MGNYLPYRRLCYQYNPFYIKCEHRQVKKSGCRWAPFSNLMNFTIIVDYLT